ncbi:MAG: hypothetical protein ABI358_08805 [Ginsengibacter sp.]
MEAMINNAKKYESINGTTQDIEAVELPVNSCISICAFRFSCEVHLSN